MSGNSQNESCLREERSTRCSRMQRSKIATEPEAGEHLATILAQANKHRHVYGYRLYGYLSAEPFEVEWFGLTLTRRRVDPIRKRLCVIQSSNTEL